MKRFSLHNFIWCLKGHSRQALIPFGVVLRSYNMQQKQLLIVFSWAVVMGKGQHNPFQCTLLYEQIKEGLRSVCPLALGFSQ